MTWEYIPLFEVKGLECVPEKLVERYGVYGNSLIEKIKKSGLHLEVDIHSHNPTVCAYESSKEADLIIISTQSGPGIFDVMPYTEKKVNSLYNTFEYMIDKDRTLEIMIETNAN